MACVSDAHKQEWLLGVCAQGGKQVTTFPNTFPLVRAGPVPKRSWGVLTLVCLLCVLPLAKSAFPSHKALWPQVVWIAADFLIRVGKLSTSDLAKFVESVLNSHP